MRFEQKKTNATPNNVGVCSAWLIAPVGLAGQCPGWCPWRGHPLQSLSGPWGGERAQVRGASLSWPSVGSLIRAFDLHFMAQVSIFSSLCSDSMLHLDGWVPLKGPDCSLDADDCISYWSYETKPATPLVFSVALCIPLPSNCSMLNGICADLFEDVDIREGFFEWVISLSCF